MDDQFFDKTESRQAEAGDLGNQGLRGSQGPGVVLCLHGGGNAPAADITSAAVPHASET